MTTVAERRPGETTVTPWGDLRELCSRRLRPGPGKERDLVVRHQRERMYAAMVATVAERGYAASRVADVIGLAGVSRSTYYTHFDDLYDCFVQTLDAVLAGAEAVMADALERDGPWDERLTGYFEALIDVVVAQPAAARMCLVESYVAGPEAVARVDRMARTAGREALGLIDQQSPERAHMPREVSRAVLGGLRTIIQTRLYAGRERELPELVPELMDWAFSYRTPPTALRKRRRRTSASLPAPDDPDLARQRIVDAMVVLVAAHGYTGTTIVGIAKEASISLTTFYKCFDGKEDAFLAALDDVMRRLFALTLPAYRRAGNWPQGVRDGLATIFGCMSQDPNLAAFAAEAVWNGGPGAINRIEESMTSFQALVAEGLGRRGQPSGIAAEAISASILALGYDGVTRGHTKRLHDLVGPATFVALAPTLGAIEACTIANGD